MGKPVGEELLDGSSTTGTSERINEAMQRVETPLHMPARLGLTTDERTELENFRTMFGRLHLGPSTFTSPLEQSTMTFGSVQHTASPADVVATSGFMAGTHVPRVQPRGLPFG